MTIGLKIDALVALRAQKKAAESVVNSLKDQINKAEEELMADMDAQAITKSTGHTATVSVGDSIRPNVQDWNQFYEFIHQNKYYHLLDRRPSVEGCRELFQTVGTVPGVVPFTKRTLRVTSL